MAAPLAVLRLRRRRGRLAPARGSAPTPDGRLDLAGRRGVASCHSVRTSELPRCSDVAPSARDRGSERPASGNLVGMPRDECENGELQPDPEAPSGGTPSAREHGQRLERHNRPITAATDQEATRPAPDAGA
jgi:hypothetical protein